MAVTDEQHRRILREMRENARVSYTSVAQRVGVTRQIVSAVVEEAVAQNRIRLTATINPVFLGIERHSYILLSIYGPSEPILHTLERMPETCFVSAIAGPYGVDAEVRVTSNEQYQDVLGRIRSIPGVSGITSNVYERILVNIDSPLPVAGAAPISIDEVDYAILRALEGDGRATFRDLGEASGVSPASARNRLQRLLRHQVVKTVGLPVRGKQLVLPPLGMGINVLGEITPELISAISAVDPEFLAVSSGSYDLIMTVSADSPDRLLAKLDQLRAIEQVSMVDTWSHLRIVKEPYGATELLHQRQRLAAAPKA